MTAADHARIIRETALHVLDGDLTGTTGRHADDCPGCRIVAALDALLAIHAEEAASKWEARLARQRAESERDEARAENERLRQQIAAESEPIMDGRFRDRLLRHALGNHEVGELVDAIESRERRLSALAAAQQPPASMFVPEGDERCGQQTNPGGKLLRATCLLKKGHEGPHRNTQGYWLQQPPAEPCTNCDGHGHNTSWPHTTCPACGGAKQQQPGEEQT